MRRAYDACRLGPMSDTATIVDHDRVTEVHATRDDDTLLVEPDDLPRATGWTLKPEGLCRDDVCVPVRDRGALARERGIDVRAFAAALGRPAALEPAASMAVLGEGSDTLGAQLRRDLVRGARRQPARIALAGDAVDLSLIHI